MKLEQLGSLLWGNKKGKFCKSIILGYSKSPNCLVCGFSFKDDREYSPESNTWGDYYEDICPCCGVQVGYNCSVKNGDGVQSYREDWIINSAEFHMSEMKPADWSKEKAIQQIKDNVPEELWENDPLVNGRE